jgi:hypothetical protein
MGRIRQRTRGLACHPLRYITADDGDPSKNQSLTQELVAQDHVIAFVYNPAPLSGPASTSYITQKRVLMIGVDGPDAFAYDSSMYVPQASSGDLYYRAFFLGGGPVRSRCKGG